MNLYFIFSFFSYKVTLDYLDMNYILVFLQVILNTFDYIFYARWLDGMASYVFLASGVLYPLLHIPLFYLGMLLFCPKNEHMDQNILILIGFLDGLNIVLMGEAAPKLPILIASILNSLIVPLVMSFSSLFLRRRYKINHFIGIIITLLGVMCAFIPDFTSEVQISVFGSLMYTLSLLPKAVSYMLKEKWLDKGINLWYMNYWIAVWQAVIGAITLMMYVVISSNYSYISSGINLQLKKENLIFLFLCQVNSSLLNTIMFYILVLGSSTFYTILNSFRVPLQGILSSFKIIGGSNSQGLNIFDYISFIFIVVASFVYRYKDEIKEDYMTPLVLDEV